MGDGEGCRRVAATEACRCPLGRWPGCGVAARCGEWEAEARGRGLVVRDIAGLTRPDLLTLPGCAPVLLMPAWLTGPVREWAICAGLCDLHREVRGIEDAR